MAEAPDWNSLSPIAPGGTPNWNDLETPEDHFGSATEIIKTAAEQGAAGLTGNLSKIAETKLFGVDPKDIEAREEANPGTAFASNLVGTAGLLGATGGLGLEAEAGAGLAKVIASNAAQGAILGGGNALTNDLAMGDPNLNASKIAAHIGISALLGGGTGLVTSALLSGVPAFLKGTSGKVSEFATPDLSVAPESLGFLDKVRVGMFSGASSPEAQTAVAQKTSQGLSALNDLASMGELSKLGGSSPEVEAFNNERVQFLKQFGNKEGKVDPKEVLSFITSKSSNGSSPQTVALNSFVRASQDLSNVNFSPQMNAELKAAQNGLEEWQSLLNDYGSQGPYVDIEYGGPAHYQGTGTADPGNFPSDYNSKFGTTYKTTKEKGMGEIGKISLVRDANGNIIQKPMASNFQEGVTLGTGASTGRTLSYGNPEVSPFEYEGPSLDFINEQIGKYQNDVSAAAQKQPNAEETANQIRKTTGAISSAQEPLNQLTNLSNARNAINNPPASIGGPMADTAAYFVGGKKAVAALEAINAIRKYSGDGGAYRLGNFLANPAKILNGVSRAAEWTNQRIGNGARRIFTGTSAQARKVND